MMERQLDKEDDAEKPVAFTMKLFMYKLKLQMFCYILV